MKRRGITVMVMPLSLCFMANYLAKSKKIANFAVEKQLLVRKLTDKR